MSWLGVWDRQTGGLFSPTGLGPDGPITSARRPAPETILARGTLLTEFEIEPAPVRQNLIRYSTREPWPMSLMLCIDPDNSLRLLMGQGDQAFTAELPLPLGRVRQKVIVSFVWNGPARSAVLSARIPELDHSALAEFRHPLLLSLFDCQRILTSADHCRYAQEVIFAALASTAEPIGATATLGALARVETTEGPREVSRLRPGDIVLTVDDEPAQVRWIGCQDLPARGSFQPHLLRAPYFGLSHDLLLAPDQKLRLTGSEIEYTFGQEAVFASVRHLADSRSILRPMGAAIQRYWQVLLDSHTVIKVSGAELESLDPTLFVTDPDYRRHSILRDLPQELIPRGRLLLMPKLKAFEAARLSR